MKNVRLYPDVPRVRRVRFGKSKTVPNQAMSLREMLKRFVRREALPVEKEGVYIESEYDLEKIPHMDRVEQEAILDDLKAATAKAKAKVDKKKKEEVDAAIAAEVAKQKEEEAKRQSDPKKPEVGQ